MDLVLEPNLKKFIFQPGRYPAVDAPYSDNCNSVVTNDITKKSFGSQRGVVGCILKIFYFLIFRPLFKQLLA